MQMQTSLGWRHCEKRSNFQWVISNFSKTKQLYDARSAVSMWSLSPHFKIHWNTSVNFWQSARNLVFFVKSVSGSYCSTKTQVFLRFRCFILHYNELNSSSLPFNFDFIFFIKDSKLYSIIQHNSRSLQTVCGVALSATFWAILSPFFATLSWHLVRTLFIGITVHALSRVFLIFS